MLIISVYLVASLLGKTDSWKEIAVGAIGGYFGYVTNGKDKSKDKEDSKDNDQIN